MVTREEERKNLRESVAASRKAFLEGDYALSYQKMKESYQHAKFLAENAKNVSDAAEYASLMREYQNEIAQLSFLANPTSPIEEAPKNENTRSFSDFVGFDEAKSYLEKDLIEPWKNHTMKNRPVQNILLYGPRGVGKSSFALSLCKELNAKVYEFHPFQQFRMANLVDFDAQLDRFFEEREKEDNLVYFFETPVPFFPDGKDDREVISELFLKYLKNVTSKARRKNKNVLFLATTSVPDKLTKKAFGKDVFNDLIRLHRPEVAVRRAIIEREMKGKEVLSDENIDYLSDKTEGFVTKDVTALSRQLFLLHEEKGILQRSDIDTLLSAFTPWYDAKYEENVDAFEKGLKDVTIHES